jgi:hypothetical protein
VNIFYCIVCTKYTVPAHRSCAVDHYTINDDCFASAEDWYWSNVRRNVEYNAMLEW